MESKNKNNNDVRIFEFEGKKYKVTRPSNKIRRMSDAVYAKAYRQAISDGFLLEAEIDELLESRGFDDKSIQRKRTNILKEIRNLEVALVKKKYKNNEEGRNIALRIQELRNDLENVDAARQELKSQSASTIAENKRFNFFTYQCVTTESGEPLWSTFEEFESDEDPLAYKAATELLTLVFDAAQVSINKAASDRIENIWLKEHKYMDDKLRLIDEKGRLIDSEGRLINEDGYFIDEEGDRVDMFGNKLDEDGNILGDDEKLLNSKQKKKQSE